MFKEFSLFTVPKPFIGEFDLIQRNAIESWLNLKPRPQIFLFGNDSGVLDVVKEYDLIHIPDIPCAKSGAPYLDGAFNCVQRESKNDVVMYSNCDIIYG